ncbi:UvrD-helicase domain-containing protein [[Kitasatospora] papulosa]|uniref:UvrD-helicase domain-containing protein n=1 Tax=[Kitasatospora] papulosa TaxID=1464011 RepID=UPI00380677EC
MTRTYLSDAFFTDKVEAMVKLLELDPLDAEQWDFLQSESTQDPQAAPGSGKTTLIGLKLALMADAWTSPTRGVCVLSHTNTAKNEIADRVDLLVAGRSLLRYPHFIGTIQSFVHTFLGLPAVRAKRVEVRSVDDAAFETAALRLLQRPEYSTLRSYVGRQHEGTSIVTGATFTYRDGELAVTGAARDLPFGAQSSSGKQLDHLKRTLARRGIFRLQDMYDIAWEYLARHPGIAAAVTTRFPFVLLDETQDTSATQHELLDLVFASSSTVVQRVGYTNQGIYSDAASGRRARLAVPAAGGPGAAGQPPLRAADRGRGQSPGRPAAPAGPRGRPRRPGGGSAVRRDHGGRCRTDLRAHGRCDRPRGRPGAASTACTGCATKPENLTCLSAVDLLLPARIHPDQPPDGSPHSNRRGPRGKRPVEVRPGQPRSGHRVVERRARVRLVTDRRRASGPRPPGEVNGDDRRQCSHPAA